jgi:hypothetical protein
VLEKTNLGFGCLLLFLDLGPAFLLGGANAGQTLGCKLPGAADLHFDGFRRFPVGRGEGRNGLFDP